MYNLGLHHRKSVCVVSRTSTQCSPTTTTSDRTTYCIVSGHLLLNVATGKLIQKKIIEQGQTADNSYHKLFLPLPWEILQMHTNFPSNQNSSLPMTVWNHNDSRANMLTTPLTSPQVFCSLVLCFVFALALGLDVSSTLPLLLISFHISYAFFLHTTVKC